MSRLLTCWLWLLLQARAICADFQRRRLLRLEGEMQVGISHGKRIKTHVTRTLTQDQSPTVHQISRSTNIKVQAPTRGGVARSFDSHIALYTVPSTGKAIPSDGCPNGWVEFSESCFRAYREPRNWQDAEKSCVDNGGHLASVHDEREKMFIWNLTRTYAWLGHHCANSQCAGTGSRLSFWEWSDQSDSTLLRLARSSTKIGSGGLHEDEPDGTKLCGALYLENGTSHVSLQAHNCMDDFLIEHYVCMISQSRCAGLSVHHSNEGCKSISTDDCAEISVCAVDLPGSCFDCKLEAADGREICTSAKTACAL
eukprot:TRINITY_DN68388_c0_g1_i1.p1 TRINITY_DN68388_c0_g1~~TRINITY_DN68388_c0_g1_i1.p1  ORF type:complete len:311 (+),score=23.92 TRINITY_DN68388_c0_g1_i1:182-1114(+)